MTDYEARGVIYRTVSARPAYHDVEDENVILLRFTYGDNPMRSHQLVNLDVKAAQELYRRLGDIVLDNNFPDELPSYLDLLSFVRQVALADFLRPEDGKSWESKIAEMIRRAKELTS